MSSMALATVLQFSVAHVTSREDDEKILVVDRHAS